MTETHTPPPGTIEVLEWIPPEIAPDFPNGHWSLEPVEEWLDFTRTEREVDLYEVSMEAAPDILGAWVAGQLGRPVHLTPEDDSIGVPRGPFRPPFPGRKVTRFTRLIHRCWPHKWITRPLYWVIPELCPLCF